jgi:hypothetical protein
VKKEIPIGREILTLEKSLFKNNPNCCAVKDKYLNTNNITT